MTIDLDALEAAAKAATPGPWEEWHAAGYPYIVQTNMDGMIDVISECRMRKNSVYIAAVNPAVVLELLAELRKARAELKRCFRERRWLADYLSANAGPDWRLSAYEYLAMAKKYAKVE